jgi:hypothetical protein
VDDVSFVCFQWNTGFRAYTPERVNTLAKGVKKYYPKPHRFICVTDEIYGFNSDVEVIRLPESARWVTKIPSPEGTRFPSSYRRLWCFSEEAKSLGSRIMQLDIDCLITGNLEPLFDYPDDFVGWRPNAVWGNSQRIGGGTWLLRTGTHTRIWDTLSTDGIRRARRMGWRGSDQAWLSYNLAATCKVWPREEGIYQKQDGVYEWSEPPANAKIIHFNGPKKYWQTSAPWVLRCLEDLNEHRINASHIHPY